MNECPECEAEFEITTIKRPAGGTPAVYCPFCKAVVVEARKSPIQRKDEPP